MSKFSKEEKIRIVLDGTCYPEGDYRALLSGRDFTDHLPPLAKDISRERERRANFTKKRKASNFFRKIVSVGVEESAFQSTPLPFVRSVPQKHHPKRGGQWT